MKQMIIAAGLALGLAGAAFAEPANGTWETEPGDTGGYLHVAIAPCGSALCGNIKAAYDKAGKEISDYEHKGKKMIWDMNADGDNYYSGGKIWAPDADKTYSSKMTLSGNKLTVKGCVAGGLICRGQTWKRVN
ncbi:MAG: DUF2147 domain-containing protein [Paracoccaceae bacterium]